jgi:hypothetical protein
MEIYTMRLFRILCLISFLFFLAPAPVDLDSATSRQELNRGDRVTLTVSVFGDHPSTLTVKQAIDSTKFAILSSKATTGTIVISAQLVRWTGHVSANAPATITIQLQVKSNASPSTITLRAVASDASGYVTSSVTAVRICCLPRPPRRIYLAIARR